MIHDDAPTAEARVPDPDRMVQGYHQSASTLNLLRAFTKGGFADLTQVHLWNKDFVATLAARASATTQLAGEIERALALHGRLRDRPRERAAAAPGRRLDEPRGAAARLRGGADAHATRSPATGTTARRTCSGSASGRGSSTARTSSSSRASTTRSASSSARPRPPDERGRALRAAEPGCASPGRLTLIARMGAEHVRELLPPLLRARARRRASRSSGPATRCTRNGIRTADGVQDAPLRRRSWPRSRASSPPAASEGVWPGGVHLEFTGEDVTECLGGAEAVLEEQLDVALRDALRPAPERAPVARPRVPRSPS